MIALSKGRERMKTCKRSLSFLVWVGHLGAVDIKDLLRAYHIEMEYFEFIRRRAQLRRQAERLRKDKHET